MYFIIIFMKRILCFVSFIVFWLTASFAVKSPDNTFSVEPQKDGLHIVHNLKPDSTCINGLRIYVGNNLYINTSANVKEFVYPFVKEGETYFVYIAKINKDWQEIKTQQVSVTASGGIGNCKVLCSGAAYNNKTGCIELKDFQFIKPQGFDFTTKEFSGSCWYSSGKPDYSSPFVWGRYRFKNNKLDLFSVSKTIANQNFFSLIELHCFKNGVEYVSCVFENSGYPFTDNHEITDVILSSGNLHPMFSPVITDYEVVGTTKDVSITLINKNGKKTEPVVLKNQKGQKKTIAVQNGTGTYNFTFSNNNEQISFNGKNYVPAFIENFDGKDIDDKNFHREREQIRQDHLPNYGYWNDECSYLDGKGNLVLEAKQKDGVNISGGVTTEDIYEQIHGMYEMRFKVDYTSGNWYSFWLTGQNDENHIDGTAVDGAEIDIFEILPNGESPFKNKLKSTVHYDGYEAAHKYTEAPALSLDKNFYNEWHVVQFVWGEKQYEFYLDGELKYVMDASKKNKAHFGGMCETPAHLIICSEFSKWAGPINPKLYPNKFIVDYVKVYVEEK